ncbi:MAG: extracellular solute-binding protein [Treponema sp.]|nr:extracellular solute-binding protein [Treponema sp.]
MKKMKKMRSVVVCALAMAVMLAGCAKKESGAASAGGGGGSSSAASAGKAVAITVEVFDRGSDGGKSDPTNNNWTKWIQEKLLRDENIAVTFIPISRWDETSATINLMAAGTAPDLCYTYNNDMVNRFGMQGGVYDLTPYVETHLQDLKEFMGADPQMPGKELIWRNINSDNGQLYSISNKYVYTATQNLFIRKDWLDKLGLPLPKTAEEYFDALTAFKTQDPGGVGANRVIPFTLTVDVRWAAGVIINSFMDPYISRKELWVNSIVDRSALVPGFKEGLRYMNRMYNAGLIDKDFPLYKSEDTMNGLIKSGVVGSIAGNWDQVYRENVALMSDMQKNVPGALFVAVDCFPSADGLTHKRGASPAGGLSFFIPKTTSQEKAEAALRYANWLARYENYHFLQFGNEGVNHTLVDGLPKVISTTGGWIQNSGGNIDYTLSINGYAMETEELTVRVLANSYPWPEEYIMDAYRISSNNAIPSPIVPVTLYVAGPLTQTLTDKSQVFYVQSIIAKTEDFDRVWDNGVKDWLVSGAQEVLNERMEKYIEP